MERKTQIHAEEGKQELIITREFDLPVALLFKAYTEPQLIEQWMGNKVIKQDNRPFGSYEFETRDPKGNLAFRGVGVIHEFVPETKITRTFEMVGTPFPVQVEFITFQSITDDTSKLTMQVIYRSVAARDQMLQLPFAQGINMAHNKLQEIVHQLK